MFLLDHLFSLLSLFSHPFYISSYRFLKRPYAHLMSSRIKRFLGGRGRDAAQGVAPDTTQGVAPDAAVKESRIKALEGIIALYNRMQDDVDDVIEPQSHETLGIQCHDLAVAADGTYGPVDKPNFFTPLSSIPPVNTTSHCTKDAIESVNFHRAFMDVNPTLSTAMSQAKQLGCDLIVSFDDMERDIADRPEHETQSLKRNAGYIRV